MPGCSTASDADQRGVLPGRRGHARPTCRPARSARTGRARAAAARRGGRRPARRTGWRPAAPPTAARPAGCRGSCGSPPRSGTRPRPAVIRLSWPGRDQLLGAEAVPVQHPAGEEPGDGVQAGVRVRPDVQAGGLGDRHRAHVVGEAPRPDGAPAPAGQRPPDPHRPDGGLAAVADLDAGRRGPGPAAAFAGGASTAATGPLMSEVSDEWRRPTAAACRLPLGRQAEPPGERGHGPTASKALARASTAT